MYKGINIYIYYVSVIFCLEYINDISYHTRYLGEKKNFTSPQITEHQVIFEETLYIKLGPYLEDSFIALSKNRIRSEKGSNKQIHK